MKMYTNELGHMIKMAAMPIYGKNLKKSVQSDMDLHCFLRPVCLNTYIFSSPELKAPEELIG